MKFWIPWTNLFDRIHDTPDIFQLPSGNAENKKS